MRIVVNDIAASKTGALSVLKDFYSYVRDNGQEHEWIFLLSEEFVEETDNIKIITLPDVKNRKKRLMFDLVNGSKYIESLNPDVLFSLQNTLPRNYKGKSVLYVHQPLGYQSIKKFSLFKREERHYAIYQKFICKMIDASVKKADKVIVQTQWMQEAMAKKTRIPLEKIIKVLPDVENLSEYKESGLRKSNLFVFPSGEILYKNHSCILKAAEILRNQGINDFDVQFTLTKEVLEQLCPNENYSNITCLGRVEREALLRTYNERILIFPSYIETFGYPLAEARSMDGMVLASDCPFSREILDGYNKARFFNPFNPKKLAALMKECIEGRIDINSSIENYVKSEELCNETSSWARVQKELTEWN